MSFTTDMPNIFPDFVTTRNLIIFIISKEYSDQLSHHKGNNVNDDLSSEEGKFNFYQFLFKSVKDDSVDILKSLIDPNNALKNQLTAKVIDKIDRLVRDMPELLTYLHSVEVVNTVLSGVHERGEVIDGERRGVVCKYSVMGVFMRRFSLAFGAMSIEKVHFFMQGFREVCESGGLIAREALPKDGVRVSDLKEKLVRLKSERLSRDQVLSSLENIYRNVDNTMFEEDADRRCVLRLRPALDKFKAMYPDISETSFLDHLLTIKNKNLETFEKNIQCQFAVKYLSKADEDDSGAKALRALQGSSKDSKKIVQAVNLFSYHRKMSEINLNSAATLVSMSLKEQAMLHYKNALFNAKLSKNSDLLDDVKNVGNSLMPINDNPNPSVYSKNSDNLSDKTALGNIRVSMLQHMHDSHSSLAELLQIYFSSVAPQRREISPICLVYLSIVLRSFGFESMAMTYLVMAACLESVRRTRNHEHVLVELSVQLLAASTASSRHDHTMALYRRLCKVGGGLLAGHPQIQSCLLQGALSQCLARLDIGGANGVVERLRAVAGAEWGLRRVQVLFAEGDVVEASRVGGDVVAAAARRREGLVYGAGHPACIEETGTQGWGCRDWALFECRCHWLLCTELLNRRQAHPARRHLASLRALASSFSFHQFLRLEQLAHAALDDAAPPPALSTRMGLSLQGHVLLLRLALRHAPVAATARPLALLTEHYRRCQDHRGLAFCWHLALLHARRRGDDTAVTVAVQQLEFLLENRFGNVQNLEFLHYAL